MSALLSGVRPSLLVPPWSVGGVAIGLDKLAVTRPVPEGEAVRLIVGWRDLPPLPGTPLWHRRRHPGRAWAGDDLRLARAAGERPAERGRVGGRYRREPGHPEGRRAGAPAAGTDGMARSSSPSSRRRARSSVRNVRQSGVCGRPAWPQTCQLTCSSGHGGRPRRQPIWASRARAIHGVSRHANSAHSGPTRGAASSLSQWFTHPGPTLASRTTASTRCGARLAADSATPPP